MILRNGVEIKNINEEFSDLNKLLHEMKDDSVTVSEITDLQSKMEADLKKIATYMDKIDKVWVNKSKMLGAYTDFQKLIQAYNEGKLKIATAKKVVDWSGTDELWMRNENKFEDKSTYLNNPENSRVKDRIHYVATKGVPLFVAGALLIGVCVSVHNNKELQEKISDADKNNIQLENEKTGLNTEINRLNAVIAVLREQLGSAKTQEEYDEILQQLKEAQEELGKAITQEAFDALNDKYNDLKKDYDDLQGKLDESNAKIESLNKQLENAGSSEEAKILREELAKAEAENAELKSKMANMVSKANYDALNKLFEDKKSEYNALKEKYDDSLAKNSELSNEVSSLNNRISELENEVSNLNSKVSSLTSSLNSANAKIKDLEKQLENAGSSGEIANLQKQLEEARKVADGLQSDLDETKKQLGKYIEDYNKLTSDYNSLVEENKALESQSSEYEALVSYVNEMYANYVGGNSSNLSAKEMVSDIITVLLEQYAQNQSSEALQKLAEANEFLAEVYGEDEIVVDGLTVAQFREMIWGIVGGKPATPSDAPTNGNVHEEGTPSNSGNGTTNPENSGTQPETGDFEGRLHE